MKIAIDSYSYHRYFGEVYAGLEAVPLTRMSMSDFFVRAHAHRVSGVSIESCFVSDTTPAHIKAMGRQLDELGLERVWAWGHPSGLHSGDAPQQVQDLKRHIDIAVDIGAAVMRICCGGRRTRPADWGAHKSKLLPLLEDAVAHAQRRGVVLAIENHIDFLADELVELVQTFDSPWLGVCLDTANNLRMLEDPAEAIRKLAPYARATHIKDVTARSGNPRDFEFWPSVPLGAGLINLKAAFDELRRHGYGGLLALEIDYLNPDSGDDEAAIVQSISHMRKLL